MNNNCKCPNCGHEFEKEKTDIMFGLNPLSQFRVIAFYEGLSFLLLLFIAMPMKYIGGEPIVVKYIGMIHGVLFMAFIYAQFNAHNKHKWSLEFNAFAFIASLIPFGTFVLEKKLEEIALKTTPKRGE